MEEFWKDVIDYEGYYQVSNLGRVKSLDRIDGANRLRKGKILKQHLDKDGYLYVMFKKDGKEKLKSVHRLVATMFINNENNLPVVDHINCIRYDNKVSNLRWCTCQQNSLNELTRKHNSAAQKRYIQSTKGKQNVDKISKPVHLVSDNDVILRRFCSIREAGREMNIPSQNIGACCQGKRNTVNGYRFKYAQ